MIERAPSENGEALSLYARMAALLLLGLLHVFSIPLFMAPDEPFHFARAHGLAEGRLVLKDNARPLVRFIYETMKSGRYGGHPLVSNMHRLLDEHEGRIPNIAWNTALYSPVPYLFHACAIKIVLAFSDPAADPTRGFRAAAYACRLTTLFLFVGCILFASRVSPDISWPLFWVAAAPMALAQASVVNIDFIVLGATALLLSTCLGSLARRPCTACLTLSCFFLLTTKPTYLPLFLIPAALVLYGEDDGPVYGAKPFLFAMAISFAAFLVWSRAAASHEVFKPMAEGMSRFFGVALDPSFQLKWIVQSPLQFLLIVKNSLSADLLSLGRQFVGVLGWLDAPIPDALTAAWWLLSLVAILLPTPAIRRGKRLTLGLLLIAAALGAVLCLYISGFMMWTPVGAATIVTQGRYYHPVVFTLFLGLAFVKPIYTPDKFRPYGGYGLVVMAVAINIGALYTTFW
ncbi:MAG: DUF2142 domain-containing protein [Desulfobacterales bacterium]|nr:DUF2142 domain-containing protein [Desulfobacterales bacterium]